MCPGAVFPKWGYRKLRRVWRYTFDTAEVLTPHHWGIWRTLITTFDLYDVIPFLERMAIIDTWESIFIRTPVELASLSFPEETSTDSANERKGSPILLWKYSL